MANQWALYVWKSQRPLKDRVEVLQKIVESEFQETASHILQAYNQRTGSSFKEFKLIPAELVTDKDVECGMDKLERSANAQEAMKNLLVATENAFGILTPAQIMRVMVNTSVFAKNNPGKQPGHELASYMMDHHPSLDEINSIGLEPENLAHVLQTLEMTPESKSTMDLLQRGERMTKQIVKRTTELLETVSPVFKDISCLLMGIYQDRTTIAFGDLTRKFIANDLQNIRYVFHHLENAVQFQEVAYKIVLGLTMQKSSSAYIMKMLVNVCVFAKHHAGEEPTTTECSQPSLQDLNSLGLSGDQLAHVVKTLCG